jgi:hypothetical protein
MGGLVTRNYLMLFGEDKVDRVILVATPNKGVSGRVNSLCDYFGDEKACADMSKDSVLIKRLSQHTPKIPFYVLIGKGCDTDGKEGDGVVEAVSAELGFAENIYIDGNCDDFFGANLHNDLLKPEKYPEVYETIKELIS